MRLPDEVNVLRSGAVTSPQWSYFCCTSLRSPPWLRHIQFPCVLPLLVMCSINGEGGCNTCKVYRNNIRCQQRGRLHQHLWTCRTACRQHWIYSLDSGRLVSKCPLERFHYPLPIYPPLSLIILSPSSCSLNPSLHLVVVSVCASHQASPLRTSSGPLLGDGPLINEWGRGRGARVCECVCVCVSLSRQLSLIDSCRPSGLYSNPAPPV